MELQARYRRRAGRLGLVVVCVVAAGWLFLQDSSAVSAACASARGVTPSRTGAAPPATAKVYSFSGIHFNLQPHENYVHVDIYGHTCARGGLGIWNVSVTVTNNINPRGTGTFDYTVAVKRVGEKAVVPGRTVEGVISLTPLPGLRLRVELHGGKAVGDNSQTVAATVKKGTCACPSLPKGQKLSRSPSKAILDFIRKREGGFRARPYDDLGPGKGACTVGYGHVLHNSPCTGAEQSITKTEAETIFQSDIADKQADMAKLIKVDLNQNQYDAILDFAFNAGIKGRKTLLDALNSCDFPALFAQMRIYVTSKGKTLQELVDRREYEISLFQK